MKRRFFLALLMVAACCSASAVVNASDHDDTPLLKTIQRPDARITDLFAFLRGQNLVLAVCLDPMIPPTVTHYVFSSDLTVAINVDKKRHVRFDDPADLAEYGGTIVEPEQIRPSVVFEMTFDATGQAQLTIRGLPPSVQSRTQFFAGLKDDPFIRGPRIGRNVAAIVIELPFEAVTGGHLRPLLVWANSHIDDVLGDYQEHGGRALRSQFVENDPLNMTTPAEHALKLGVVPDVLIVNPAAPIAFPNGREITDDVVDLAPDPRVLGTDAPFPTANDLPFLTVFPYLAPPHPAP